MKIKENIRKNLYPPFFNRVLTQSRCLTISNSNYVFLPKMNRFFLIYCSLYKLIMRLQKYDEDNMAMQITSIPIKVGSLNTSVSLSDNECFLFFFDILLLNVLRNAQHNILIISNNCKMYQNPLQVCIQNLRLKFSNAECDKCNLNSTKTLQLINLH